MKRTHNCTPSADRKVISNGRNVVNYARIVTIARDRKRAKQTLTRLCEIAPIRRIALTLQISRLPKALERDFGSV
jgi:hypothetical protein